MDIFSKNYSPFKIWILKTYPYAWKSVILKLIFRQKDENQFQYNIFCKDNVVLVVPKPEPERPVFVSTDQEGNRQSEFGKGNLCRILDCYVWHVLIMCARALELWFLHEIFLSGLS